MKILALGDTHGRDNWKRIVKSNDFDKVVFIGDYFDSREGHSAEDEIKNFQDIIHFKKSNPDKVIVLIGNHDYHYFDPMIEKYSGFQNEHQHDISDLLVDAYDKKLIQISYIWQRYLFTHAGVTKTWCRENLINLKDLENSMNMLFDENPFAFRFTCGPYGSPTGDDITQSPLWVRPGSLLIDKLDSYIQIVGHTQHEQIKISNNVAFIDSLGTSGEYLVVEDGEMRCAV